MKDGIFFSKDRIVLRRFIDLAIMMQVFASYLDEIKSKFMIEPV